MCLLIGEPQARALHNHRQKRKNVLKEQVVLWHGDGWKGKVEKTYHRNETDAHFEDDILKDQP